MLCRTEVSRTSAAAKLVAMYGQFRAGIFAKYRHCVSYSARVSTRDAAALLPILAVTSPQLKANSCKTGASH